MRFDELYLVVGRLGGQKQEINPNMIQKPAYVKLKNIPLNIFQSAIEPLVGSVATPLWDPMFLLVFLWFHWVVLLTIA